MPPLNTTVVITINGVRHECPRGATVLDVLRETEDDVPHLCHDDRIAPAGACRLCLVDVQGCPRPLAACTTEVDEGMVIQTHTRELESLRRANLSLIARHYPASAVAAEPSHPFHELLATYDVAPGDEPPLDPYVDASHPYLGVAMDRCINCYRCVRICDEVQGADVWQVWNRGPATKVSTRGHASLIDAGCVSCGACSDTCPTGAIFDKREQPADAWTRTTCVYCGVGCQMDVGTAQGKVVASRPAAAPVNKGHLCVKGRYAYEFNHSADRVTTPLIRRDGSWSEATWDEALDETASRLRAILDRSGPDVIGILGSARATNEENYYAQKFARVVLGTHLSLIHI